MKTRARLFGLALLSMAATFAASAADAPRYRFECDAPAGNYSNWSRTVSTKRVEIAGKLRIGELYAHKKWLPVASLVLRRSSDHATQFGVRISAENAKAKELAIETYKVGGRDNIGTVRIGAKWVPFTLKLEPDGTLTATVGDARASIKLGDFTPETFELSCSSGSFEYADVTVRETD